MLVLTRRVGEGIMIGDCILFKVLGVHGRQVRVGIQAPKSVNILREELSNQVKDRAVVADLSAGIAQVTSAARDPGNP
jgi:carbon storage regulator